MPSGALRKHAEGSEDPELRLRHPFATEAEARKTAKGALERSKRSAKITVNLARFWPEITAEATVRLSGVRQGLEGDGWLRAPRIGSQ